MSGDPVSVVLPQAEATVAALKVGIAKELEYPEEFIAISQSGRILRDAELVRYSDTTPLTFVLNGSKVEIRMGYERRTSMYQVITEELEEFLEPQIWHDCKNDLFSLANLTPERRAELEGVIRNTRINFQHDRYIDELERNTRYELEQLLQGIERRPPNQIIGNLPKDLETGPLPDAFVQNFFHEYLVWVLLRTQEIEVPALDPAQTRVGVPVVPNIIGFVVSGNEIKITSMSRVKL